MEFMLVTLGMIGLIVGVLVLLARAYPGSGADLVDWRPSRSFEDEAMLEAQEVEQMMAAQNEYRRRRGEADVTNDEVRRWVSEDEAVRERARRRSAERARAEREGE
jgi:hypothetical protein